MIRSRRLRSAACAVAATAGLLVVAPGAQAAEAPVSSSDASSEVATAVEHSVRDSAASIFSCRKNPTLVWCS
ncbi:hypothetical protein [Corynebacterium mastitidis]|uniref:hypothetical protein n=1 Tax=Corynebacterium mastitidis TaxID=161890 RepID=UPI00254B96B8|nr:hypothetical protein [Corynebacterium mastitidis]MDK8451557.1 hypothetical protein [Corynebacterium mastitidis]